MTSKAMRQHRERYNTKKAPKGPKKPAFATMALCYSALGRDRQSLTVQVSIASIWRIRTPYKPDQGRIKP
jgi:hypothetical protein